jgi:Rrf2 family cysteine metabolism transcriptional repressor
MLVTTLEGYALKALIYIATKDSKRATIKEISEKNRISFPYILRICSELRRHGILISIRGRSGGYVLTRDPSDISIYEIIKAVGRETVEIKCEYGKRRDLSCYQSECISLRAWRIIKNNVDDTLKKIKLSDLILKKGDTNNGSTTDTSN